MANQLSQVIAILRAAEPTSAFAQGSNYTLLENVAEIINEHDDQSTITDWPFENFWFNPTEPRHSKLLEYFIKPHKEHPWRSYLLKEFLNVLDDTVKLPKCFLNDYQNCVVRAETRDGFGQIDLWISCNCNGLEYVIIVENKINRADNQKDQLQRYVERATIHITDKQKEADIPFKEQIFVFFLPLTDDTNPDPDDLNAIQEDATYRKITFEKHIRKWLKAVLKEWPFNKDNPIREHLSYYRNLLNYLINQRKQQIMSQKILNRLKETNPLPTLSDVNALVISANELMDCFKRLLRWKTLREIQARITGAVLFRQSGEAIESLTPESEAFFDVCVGVYVPVTNDVGVCFSGHLGNTEQFWIGYLRLSECDNKDEKEAANEEAKDRFRAFKDEPYISSPPEKREEWWANRPWYRWESRSDLNYDNCLAKAAEIADKLLVMREKLANRLPV